MLEYFKATDIKFRIL